MYTHPSLKSRKQRGYKALLSLAAQFFLLNWRKRAGFVRIKLVRYHKSFHKVFCVIKFICICYLHNLFLRGSFVLQSAR